MTSMGASTPSPARAHASAKSWMSRCCTGVAGNITPSSGSRSASPGASAASGRFRRSTMGRAGDSSTAASVSPTWHTWRTSSTDAIITANALPSRCLRRRSNATARGLRPSQARWKPPSPFTATIPPARSISAARASAASLCSRFAARTTGVSGASTRSNASETGTVGSDSTPSSPVPCAPAARCSRQSTWGPQAKHASGCAWKRRSAGSAYSAAQIGHMGKSFMDVWGRS